MHNGIRLAAAVLFVCFTGMTVDAGLVTLNPGPTDGKDAALTSGTPWLNVGDNTSFILNWGGDFRSIGLIEFDLSAVPSGSTINSAVLSLFHSANSNLGSQYDVFRVTSPWSEATVTFDTAPSFDPTPVGSLTIADASVSVYRDWDVTSLIQGWANGAFANDGMWIEEIPVAGSATAYFDSSDSIPGQRPILTIDFMSPASATPEPAAFALFAMGGLGLIFVQRRRARSRTDSAWRTAFNNEEPEFS